MLFKLKVLILIGFCLLFNIVNGDDLVESNNMPNSVKNTNVPEEVAYKWLIYKTLLLEKERENLEIWRQKQQEKEAQMIRKLFESLKQSTSVLKDFHTFNFLILWSH